MVCICLHFCLIALFSLSVHPRATWNLNPPEVRNAQLQYAGWGPHEQQLVRTTISMKPLHLPSVIDSNHLSCPTYSHYNSPLMWSIVKKKLTIHTAYWITKVELMWLTYHNICKVLACSLLYCHFIKLMEERINDFRGIYSRPLMGGVGMSDEEGVKGICVSHV